MDKIEECIACKSKNIYLWLLKKDIEKAIWNIYRCSECGTAFLNPRPTKEYLESMYAKSGHGLKEPITYSEVSMREREYPNAIVDAERMISKAIKMLDNGNNNKALDIGSGYGFFTATAIKNGFKVTAINPSKWENDVFQEMNGFRPIEKFFENIDFSNEIFSLVIMSQVMEHIHNVDEVLSKIKSLMNKKSVLVVAIPNIDSLLVKILRTKDNSCLWVPEHLNYFSKKGLFKLLDRSDYSILKYQPISRIPYNFLSKRLNLKSILSKACNQLIRITQKIPLLLLIYA
jgi:2-polyprenyl-3-methyl-5-hydroxy-6-metoxy-1,4-benzoquinol methylase